MFSKDDVGKRVTSINWGIGTIVEFDEPKPFSGDRYPVKCEFPNYDNTSMLVAWFGADGTCCIGESSNDDITLLVGDITEWSNPVKYEVEDIVELKTESGEFSKHLKVTSVDDKDEAPTQVVIDGRIVPLTPELLAEAFWAMDSSQQARFYNHLDTVADFPFHFNCKVLQMKMGLL